MEIWKDIEDYEGLYQVSNYGRVKSLNYHMTGREEILKVCIDSEGYLFVNLYKNGVKKQYSIHRLVAIHFIPNSDNKPDVHHKDHNKENNNVDNLVWLTYEEHAAEHPERNKAIKKTYSKHINQFTSDGMFLRAWYSAHDIERELGYSNGNIIKCCQGGFFSKSRNKWVNVTQAYGYIWKYADKE